METSGTGQWPKRFETMWLTTRSHTQCGRRCLDPSTCRSRSPLMCRVVPFQRRVDVMTACPTNARTPEPSRYDQHGCRKLLPRTGLKTPSRIRNAQSGSTPMPRNATTGRNGTNTGTRSSPTHARRILRRATTGQNEANTGVDLRQLTPEEYQGGPRQAGMMPECRRNRCNTGAPAEYTSTNR